MTKPAKYPTEYNTYSAMMGRCYNHNNHKYKDYGGRGIKICARWRGENGFTNFFADMGKRMSSGLSIERINNDGNYEPNNCRWATVKEQGRNKRNNVWLTVRGQTMKLLDWAEKTGIKASVIHVRLARGWSQELATSPVPITARRSAEKNKRLRYFTGLPCIRGHIAERSTTNGTCFECRKELRRAINPSHIRQT